MKFTFTDSAIAEIQKRYDLKDISLFYAVGEDCGCPTTGIFMLKVNDAGMANMNFGLFLLFTTVGTVIWNTVLIYLGAAVGSQWETIVHYMDIYSNVAYVILGIIGIAVIIWYIRKRKQTVKAD